MASLSSSSSLRNPTISQEEIKLFHTIDRAIFARLVLNLGRDLGESMHVMALFLWLEHYCSRAGNLVYDIQTWPDSLINALADEAVQCFICIKTDEFSFNYFEGTNNIIPLIRRLTKNQLSLRSFHDHRLDIIRGTVQLVQDVCVRAFDDIVQEALGLIDPLAADQNRIEHNLVPLRFYGPLIKPLFPVYGDFGDMGNQQIFRPNIINTGHLEFSHGVEPNDLSLRAQRNSLNNEMEELLDRIRIICINSLEENNDNKEVAADDRTIFLTFSKGYAISENEVREFFTRTFGENFIEGIEMQEVPAGEQPLYARLVLKSASGLGIVLNGKAKAKFSINGKHVWSRKFVRRNPQSPV
ncbi:hypothetical protein REPUB_Repub03eG0194200 [Reevesia pubescens]